MKVLFLMMISFLVIGKANEEKREPSSLVSPPLYESKKENSLKKYYPESSREWKEHIEFIRYIDRHDKK